MYNACMTGQTGRLKGQAMQDFHAENVANVPYEFETACGMSPEAGTKTWKTNTMQPMGQDGRPLTILKPNIARCTKNHTETELHGPHSESQLIIHHGVTNLVTRYPAPHIKPPTTWAPNGRNPKTLPGNHLARAQEMSRDTTDNGIKTYLYPPPVNPTFLYKNAICAPSRPDHIPPGISAIHKFPHKDPPTQPRTIPRFLESNKNNKWFRQQCLKTVDILDKRNWAERTFEPATRKPRAQDVSESEHRKRRNTATWQHQISNVSFRQNAKILYFCTSETSYHIMPLWLFFLHDYFCWFLVYTIFDLPRNCFCHADTTTYFRYPPHFYVLT